MVVQPFGTVIDGFVNRRPVFFWELWFGFDEGHDDERSDGRAEGVVGAGGRGVDIQALAVFGAAPGAVGSLVGEEEFDAAVDNGFDLLGLWRRDGCRLGALCGERG